MNGDGALSFEVFREQWLTDIREGDPSTTALGHRFSHKLIRQWRDIEDSSSDLVYCDGAGDGGIDIAYLDRGEDEGNVESGTIGHTWYLVQSKYGAAFRGAATLLAEAQKVVDTLDGRRANLSSLAQGLLERILNFKNGLSDRDRIVLLYATEYPLDESQSRALGDVRALGRGRLGSHFDVESISIQTIYQRNLNEAEAIGLEARTVPIVASLVRSGGNLLVGSTSLTNLYQFLKAYRDKTEDLDQLYEKNVRRFLGGRGKVNRGMQETLNSAPEQFGLYNNGITIVVKDFRSDSNGSFELVEPYIVNGCQTTRTIWEICHIRLEAGGTGQNPEAEEWKRRAGEGVVITKVVKVGNEGDSMLEAITRYTNTQNAIREKDFLTLTSDFKSWARQMADRYHVFLEIQRGGWDSRRALQKQNPSLEHFSRMANAFDLMKVYGCGLAGRSRDCIWKEPAVFTEWNYL